MNSSKAMKRNGLMSVMMGSFSALIISIVGILLFAFIIKLTGMNSGLVMPINQVIKVISILVGVMIMQRRCDKNIIMNGIMIGGLYTIIAFLVFSSLNGEILLNKTIINDLVFSMISGGICGMLINLFRRK